MRSRMIQLAGLSAFVALVLAAGAFSPAINRQREELDMYGVEAASESAPPEYAFAIQAFGAFRGLVTDIAFIRAEELKRQGRYYDAMQLHSWICKLQPRFPSVWEYCSWNMAWNISVTTYTPQERWNWVYNGVKLIRDEGLRYNPRAVNLYRQLAWIFVNKMSETTDEYHMTYKRQWAYRMHLVLGRPPDPFGDYRPDKPVETSEGGIGEEKDALLRAARHAKEQRAERDRRKYPDEPEKWENPNMPLDPEVGKTRPLEYEIVKKAAFDRLQAIADAPRTLDGLYAAYPETRELVAQLRDLGVRITDDRLSEDDYWKDEGLAFTFFKPYRRLDDPVSLIDELRRKRAGTESGGKDAALERFDQIVGVRDQRPAGQALLRFLQRKVLLEVYKLDPQKMAALTDRFGPMDWRLVDAHSLYWVNEGLIAGNETISQFGNDKINTARLIFFSLRNLYLRNRLVFEPDWQNISYSYINFTPDLNFIESMHQAYLKYGKLLDPRPREQGGVGETFRAGHQNFLTDAVCLLYFAGREREARHYFQYLRDNYSISDAGDFNPYFARPLETFVMEAFLESDLGYNETRDAIGGLLQRAYDELAQGNLARYYDLVAKALDLHSKYNEGRMTRTTDKMQLPPFRQYQADVLRAVLQQPSLTPAVTVHKARLWRALPLDLKQRVYDDVRELFARECEVMDFAVERAFPAPPGMEQYRQERAAQERQPKKETEVETPAQQPG